MHGIHVGILAIVEGITEFLPVSSTGHLILTSSLLGITPTEFTKTFEIFIQLGAILAVLFLYRNTIRTRTLLWAKIFIAFIPSAVIGVMGYSFIKTYLFENTTITAVALAAGGLMLIIVEYLLPHHTSTIETTEHLSYKKALLIGLFQACSVVPGVSRAAATIIGGMIVGLNRQTATEFSFLLAVPTIVAATGLDIAKSNFTFSVQEWGILFLGSAIAFITAHITIRLFVKFVSNHSFVPFGIYRIIVAGLFALLTLT